MSKRAARVLLLLTAVALFLIACYRVLETPFWNYNGSRLMPSFAVARGIDYYVLPHQGPLYCSLYGPLISLVYLPATLLSSPNGAVLAGSLITALLCFSAAAFLHFAPYGGRFNRTSVLGFLTAGFLMCYLEPLKYACFAIHADGPGLACGAVACGALYFRTAGNRWALPVSALFAVLAIFCKQTFLPISLALLAYTVASGGWRTARRYFLWLAAAGIALGAIALGTVGPERLYHCLLWVPAHHPWNEDSGLVAMIQAMRSFIRLSLVVLVPLAACGAYFLSECRPNRDRMRLFAATRCSPLLIVGIAMLPSAIAGRAKAGGDINSFSLALFFLTCGLTVMLADIASGMEPVFRRLAATVLVAMLALPLISEAALIPRLPAKARELPQAGQNVAFEYLRSHPGEAYFPWFPIAHYFAEHRFRHYAFGIADRLMAGEPVSVEDFRAYIPANPRIVAFSSDGTPEVVGFDLMDYLPEYRCCTNDAALPGWRVYRK